MFKFFSPPYVSFDFEALIEENLDSFNLYLIYLVFILSSDIKMA